MKKILFIIFIVLLAAGGTLYLFWQDIFQFSAEKAIMEKLPDYLNIGDIDFDLKKGIVTIKDIEVKNPEGYNRKYFAEVEKIVCYYKAKNNNLLDGVKITELTVEQPSVYIERRSDGRINAAEMQQVFSEGKKLPLKEIMKKEVEKNTISGTAASETLSKIDLAQKSEKHFAAAGASGKNLTDFLELNDTVKIQQGNVYFADSYQSKRSYRMSLNEINSDVRIILNDTYTELISLETIGGGIVNSDPRQHLGWNVSFRPNSSGFSMANTIDLENLDITLFEHYYAEFSPVDIKNGICSGNMIVNLDNENIGSMNTLMLSDFEFEVKKGTLGTRYWAGTFHDVVKYLESSEGTVKFDFKIKGTIDNPKFYPGPYVQAAMQNLVVDKVTEVMDVLSGKSQKAGTGTQPAAGGSQAAPQKKSDAEKVIDIINIFLD